jgi:hypothetical protein
VVEFCTFGAVRVHSGGPPGPPPTAWPSGPRFGGLLPGTREASLAEARRAAVFPVPAPVRLGPPDQVLLPAGAGRAQFVVLRYGPGPGRPPPGPGGMAVELDEFAGTMAPYLDKYLYNGTAERVTVGADQGLWMNAPHEIAYVDGSGQTQVISARLAGPALLWQHAGVTFRLEGDLRRDEALMIARSLQ